MKEKLCILLVCLLVKSSTCFILPSTFSPESVFFLQLVLSNLRHLFVTVVNGPVTKSSAFAMGKPGGKDISICFCRSSPITDLKNSYQVYIDLIDENGFSVLDSHRPGHN